MGKSEKQKAIDKACHILRKHGITSVPVNVTSLAQKEGVNVSEEPLNSGVSGVIVIKDRRAVIGVNETHHPYRQRFTIAHELGHFLLHHDDKAVFVSQSLSFYRDKKTEDGSDLQEITANAFAAELLMPEHILKEYLQGGIDLDNEVAIKRLARKFEVSQKALTFRLANLELI